MLCAGTSHSAGKNLCAFGKILAETVGILIIDVDDFIGTEDADFLSSSVIVASCGSSFFRLFGFASAVLGRFGRFGSRFDFNRFFDNFFNNFFGSDCLFVLNIQSEILLY